MSYNLIAISTDKIDWKSLHKSVNQFKSSLEYIPIMASEIIKYDSLGISIPSKKIDNKTWQETEIVLNILIKNFRMRIYELYSGDEITENNFNVVKSNLD